MRRSMRVKKAQWGGSLVMASKYRRGLFRGFDFLSAFMAFLLEPRMELKPIPVRARRPRR
jgi:hypothetical protein